MKTKDFTLQVKELTEDGTFEGYGSIFGNVDAYGEKVVPGAFVESLAKHRREGTNVLMLWQHDPDNPIGVWEDLAEDAKGLYGKGRLILEIQKAREVRALMLQKAIGGLSIGYREIDTEPDGNVRLLKKLELYEISPVAFPANRRARIEAVKFGEFEALARRGERLQETGAVLPRRRADAGQGIRGNPAGCRVPEKRSRTDRLCRLRQSHSE